MPALKTVEKELNYSVGSATSVDLTTTIGDFQPGTTRVVWGEIHEVENGETLELSADGDSLVGEHAFVTSVVQNKNPRTNRTSVTIDLEGGTRDVSRTYSATASSANELVVYMITINFVA